MNGLTMSFFFLKAISKSRFSVAKNAAQVVVCFPVIDATSTQAQQG